MIASIAHWLIHQLREAALTALGIREEVRLVRYIGPELEEWRKERDGLSFDELCPVITDAELIEDEFVAAHDATTKQLAEPTELRTEPLTPFVDALLRDPDADIKPLVRWDGSIEIAASDVRPGTPVFIDRRPRSEQRNQLDEGWFV